MPRTIIPLSGRCSIGLPAFHFRRGAYDRAGPAPGPGAVSMRASMNLRTLLLLAALASLPAVSLSSGSLKKGKAVFDYLDGGAEGEVDQRMQRGEVEHRPRRVVRAGHAQQLRAAGLNGRSLRYPRGKTLGGCSSINGMIYMRGQAADYDHWRQLGLEGWGWESILPYFKRHEDFAPGANEFHGKGGELGRHPIGR